VRIRSVTFFTNPGYPLKERIVEEAGTQLAQLKRAIQDVGFEVQTTRMATPPFPVVCKGSYSHVAAWARTIADVASSCGIDYVSVGPALPDESESSLALVDILSASPKIFASAIVAEPARGVSLAAVRRAANTIFALSTVEADGFANLRFAALACVPPGSPFFPAAYHDDGGPAFAIAPEAAELAVEAAANANTLREASGALTSSLRQHAESLLKAVGTSKCPARFLGIDFSLAPFPEASRSLGAAFEKLGVPRAGLAGSATAAAFWASALDAAEFPRTGFCGLLLPPFEDSVLAARAADGSLTISNLLLYATLCGTGLDTIPLAGETTAEQIAPLLMDIAALALRHGKPLTARLMPLPGKSPDDSAAFDFAYFAPTRVFSLPSEGVAGLFANGSEDWLKINKRN
jgi:uncharacterized protein